VIVLRLTQRADQHLLPVRDRTDQMLCQVRRLTPQPRRHRCQLPERNRRRRRGLAGDRVHFGQIAFHRIGEPDRAILHELHQHEASELLGDRSDAIDGVFGGGELLFAVSVPIGARPDKLRAVHDTDGDAADVVFGLFGGGHRGDAVHGGLQVGRDLSGCGSSRGQNQPSREGDQESRHHRGSILRAWHIPSTRCC
jgi:hypothetical protein